MNLQRFQKAIPGMQNTKFSNRFTCFSGGENGHKSVAQNKAKFDAFRVIGPEIINFRYEITTFSEGDSGYAKYEVSL